MKITVQKLPDAALDGGQISSSDRIINIFLTLHLIPFNEMAWCNGLVPLGVCSPYMVIKHDAGLLKEFPNKSTSDFSN